MTEGTNTLLYYFRKDAMPLALNLSYYIRYDYRNNMVCPALKFSYNNMDNA